MFDFLRARTDKKIPAVTRARPPDAVEHPGAPPFVIDEHTGTHEGLPYLRWRDVYAWVDSLPEAERAQAWGAVEAVWNEHLARGLGPSCRVDRGEGVIVVSSLEPHEAAATVDFMQKTLRRILRTLEGVARPFEYGSEVLVLLDDEDTYYRYVSRFYPDEGEFAFSGGMKVNDDGAIYYIGVRGRVRDIEPLIAHEMAHGCVSHLPLPLWLNEGIAVNSEYALVRAVPAKYPPDEMRRRHLEFWTTDTIQEFWSGDSFHRTDDGTTLSYDLARILVEHLAADWPRFVQFANAAHWEDGGAAAARAHLGTSPGALAAAFLEARSTEPYEPRPDSWRRPGEPVSKT
jgi:hypothetical protein